jgi:hypothetical protein
MNPYDFVRIDWGRHPPVRRPYARYDRFEGWTGWFEGQITAETPVFINTAAKQQPRPFQTNAAGTPIVPGSSLKGLFRSLVETVGPGCWRLFDGRYRDHVDYKDKLPRDFRPCSSVSQVCPSCRLFGLIGGNRALVGKVAFDDAVCTQRVPHEAIFTPILDAPKPRHSAWYLDSGQQWVAGRKFYFHQANIQTQSSPRTSREQHIQPLGTGSTFSLRGQFMNLADDEWPVLLYALVLEPGLRHKFGYAKPAGFGSVRVALTRLVRWRDSARYTSGEVETYEGEPLQGLINQQTARCAAEAATMTLADLRRVWRWPPTGTYRYPDRKWFDLNPTAPISATS